MLSWSGGFAKMDVDKPENYTLSDKYVRDMSDKYDESDKAWALSFKTPEFPETTVTFFPEREGVKMASPDSPDYKEGKERAVIGMVLLHIILSGENVMVEL